jgi:hypothetical protein
LLSAGNIKAEFQDSMESIFLKTAFFIDMSKEHATSFAERLEQRNQNRDVFIKRDPNHENTKAERFPWITT